MDSDTFRIITSLMSAAFLIVVWWTIRRDLHKREAAGSIPAGLWQMTSLWLRPDGSLHLAMGTTEAPGPERAVIESFLADNVNAVPCLKAATLICCHARHLATCAQSKILIQGAIAK